MDTIIIKIYGPNKFKIKNRHWFLPEVEPRKYDELSTTEKQSKTRYYLRRFILKAPPQGSYIPKIDILETLDRKNKKIVYILIAESSIPKLLYGNSLQEISDEDGGKVMVAFQRALVSLGIIVDINDVAGARISALHLCKNIVLPKDILLQDILAELNRVDIDKTVDVTVKERKNGGQTLHIYSGTVERVFYDKIVDTIRPKNKRKDKGHMDYEREIIDRYSLYNTEVFRYEYRIKKTQTVSREVNSALERKPLTYVAFRDLFKKDLSKKILLKSWRDLVQRPENQLALIGPTDNFRLLLQIIEGAKKSGGAHSLNRALISFGIVCIIKTHGAKELKKTIFRHWLKDHPERLTKKIKEASELAKGLPYSNGIAYVDSSIERYELVTRSLLDKVVYNE